MFFLKVLRILKNYLKLLSKMYYYLLLTNNKLLLSPAEEFYRAINSGSYKTVFYSVSFSQSLLYLYYNNLGLFQT